MSHEHGHNRAQAMGDSHEGLPIAPAVVILPERCNYRRFSRWARKFLPGWEYFASSLTAWMCVAGDNIVPIDVISTDSIRRERNMNWIGKWKNQYGSILEISDDSDNRIVGTFRTALEDSVFFGQEIAIVGVHGGACISVSGAGRTVAGDAVVSYTGLLRDGRMETLWYVATDATLTARKEGEPATIRKLNW